MFGKKKKQILEQAERIKALEAQAKTLSEDNQKMKDRMDDVERREKGIGRAISEATVTVDNMISDAQRKAGVLLDETKAECDTQSKKAERVVEDD
jgi:phosphoribosylaminoimidazole-succinocarboxamide synthase